MITGRIVPRTRLLAGLTTGLLLVLTAGGAQAQLSRTYTTSADFDLGVLSGVNSGIPDQLQLDQAATDAPLLAVAASGRGTVVRIDATTGVVLGEYRTAPAGRATDPSRATLDAFGNIWLGNRAEDGGSRGSVVKVGVVIGGTRVDQNGVPNPTGEYLAPPYEYSTCVDRDGDGLLRTSRGLGSILDWPDVTDGAGGAGGGPAFVQDALDECILVYQRVDCPGVRQVSVDGAGDVWAGGYDSGPNCFQKLDGLSGQVLSTLLVPSPPCGGYAGLVDGSGVLWSSSFFESRLMRYDPAGAQPAACIGAQAAAAGVALDSTGSVWVAGAGEVRRYDPLGNPLGVFPIAGASGLLGIDVTPVDDNVWVASFSNDVCYRLDSAGALLATIPVGDRPTGVSVDADGYVWVVDLGSDDARRIDPATNAVNRTVFLGGGAQPFNPSQATGTIAFVSTIPAGTWELVQDAGVDGARWTDVSWTEFVPAGSSLTVEVRAADDPVALLGLAWQPASNGVAPGLRGRYMEARVLFERSPVERQSPILFDFSLAATEGPVSDCLTPNRRNPGSLLLFPEFDSGIGEVSALTVTNTACGADQSCLVEFVYIDGDTCQEYNRTELLTPCDTLTLLVRAHNPNQDRGFLYVFARDPVSGRPMAFNHLIGGLLVVQGIQSFEYSMNAVAFQGLGQDGYTDLDADGVRDLDGLEYGEAPDELLIPRFIGQPSDIPSFAAFVQSELILVSLSGGPAFLTTLDFLIMNDNEEVFSAEHTFSCWEKVGLPAVSGSFTQEFLVNWTAHDLGEFLGGPPGLETGWFRVDGAVASSTAVSLADPAFYAVLVERIGPFAAADLPFELCTQPGGGLLPRGVLGR